MKFFISIILFSLVLSGCSSTVRPPYTDTDDVTDEMLEYASSLNIDLSEESATVLAKGIYQARQYCQRDNKELEVEVHKKHRKGELVPVIHLICTR